MKTILLLGAYGQNNLGDDALLEVFLEQLRDSHVVVNSARPAHTSQRYGVESIATYSGWPRFRRPLILLRSRAIVFGGGSLLKEIEGGWFSRVIYFVRILALLLFGKLFGRPTAMLGVGIGPLDQPLYRWLSRQAANLTDLICVRDAESRELLQAIGVRRPVYVTADPVFTLAEAPDSAVASASARSTVVVIPRYSLSEAHLAALAAGCDHLVETLGARIVLLPFQTGYRGQFDDLPACERIATRMRNSGAAEVVTPETPCAAQELIGNADLVLSTRLHGLIFATLAAVPLVALDYEVKVRNFMQQIGQRWANVSLAELEAGILPATLDAAWERRHESRVALDAQRAGLRARGQENFEHFRELERQPANRLLTGGALLFGSMTIVNAGNYLFNLVLGRWLGPDAFADLSLVVTVMLIVTLVTSALQTISAKFSAAYAASGDEVQARAMRSWLGGWAWVFGAGLLAVFALGAPLWQQFFHTASAWPFALLGLGLPMYFAQGVDRGVLQGRTRFAALALSYQAEMWVRLVVAVALVALGLSVSGAVLGVTLSLAAAWLVGNRALRPGAWSAGVARAALPSAERTRIVQFCGPVLAALIGQVLINNSDILIVKHFFATADAGRYAALALIGRIVFFATLSVVAALFPIVAQKQQRGEPHRHLLWFALGLVAACSAVVIAGALLVPELMVRLLFGDAYLAIAPLLWLYALATALYALANVVINYRLAAGESGGSALVVLFGVLQVAGLLVFHASLFEVVLVQITLMVGLLTALLALVDEVGAKCYRWCATLRRRWRQLLMGGAALALLLLMWQVAGAQTAASPNLAQEQIKLILPSLRDSEAEHAAGAYIPRVGAVLTLDLVRGPNALKEKLPADGVRDWAIYLMGAFGPQLSAVPPEEAITLSIDYYDFGERFYHQLVVTCRAADVQDSAKYQVWLDGLPIDAATGAALGGQP